MSVNLTLRGDEDKAGEYLPFSKKKLMEMKTAMRSLNLSSSQRKYSSDDVDITVSSQYGQDKIDIYAEGLKQHIFVVYAGDTTYDYTHKKYYQYVVSESDNYDFKLVEKTEDESKELLGVHSLIDDGMYYIEGIGTSPDIYQHTFLYKGNGLNVPVAVSSGIAAKKYFPDEIRYILTGIGEDDYVTKIIDENYILSDFHYRGIFGKDLSFYSFMSYKDVPNTSDWYVLFSGFTNSSVDETSNVLMAADVWDSVYVNPFFLDGAVSTLYLYVHNSDGTHNSIKIANMKNATTPAIIMGVNSNYKDNNSNRVYGISMKWLEGDYDHSINKSVFDIENNEFKVLERYIRSANNPENAYSSVAESWKYLPMDSTLFTIKDYKFNGFKDTMILPINVVDDNKMDYIEIDKQQDPKSNLINNINYDFYCANKLVHSTGFKSTLQYGGEDYMYFYFGKHILYPYKISPVLFYHNKEFDATFYMTSKITNVEEIETDYWYDGYGEYNWYYETVEGCPDPVYTYHKLFFYKINILRFDFTVSYHIWVNGKNHTFDYKGNSSTFSFFTRPIEQDLPTLTCSGRADPPIPGTHIHYFKIDSWTNSGYDWQCNTINQENYAMTRPFFDSIDGQLFFDIDVYKTSYKNRVSVDSDNDLTATYEPPPYFESDANNIYDRKWMLFNKNGDYKTIEPPQKDGNNWERVNGVGLL